MWGKQIKRTKDDVKTSFSRVRQHPVCLSSQLMERAVRSDVSKAAQHERKALDRRKREAKQRTVASLSNVLFSCLSNFHLICFRNIQYAVEKMSFGSRQTNSHFWVYDGAQTSRQSPEVVMVSYTKMILGNIPVYDSFSSADAATNLSSARLSWMYSFTHNCLRPRGFFLFTQRKPLTTYTAALLQHLVVIHSLGFTVFISHLLSDSCCEKRQWWM